MNTTTTPHQPDYEQDARNSRGEMVQKLINAAIPPLYQDTNVDRLNANLTQACSAWIARENSSRGLGIVGKTGIGKSRSVYRMVRELIESAAPFEESLAAAIDERMVEHKKWARSNGVAPDESDRPKFIRDDVLQQMSSRQQYWRYYFPVVNTINDAALSKLCAEAAFHDNTEERSRLRGLYTANVLFIDDLGQSKLTERVCAELYQIVEERSSNLLPILFTSNFGGNQLAARFTDETRGAAVVRRLAEFCEVVRV